MSKFEIEVEGLPEGWQAVAIRKALDTDTHVFIDGEVFEISKHPEMLNPKNWPHLIVKKKRPRRITFEETDEKVNDLCGRHWVRTDGSAADFRIISENKTKDWTLRRKQRHQGDINQRQKVSRNALSRVLYHKPMAERIC